MAKSVSMHSSRTIWNYELDFCAFLLLFSLLSILESKPSDLFWYYNVWQHATVFLGWWSMPLMSLMWRWFKKKKCDYWIQLNSWFSTCRFMVFDALLTVLCCYRPQWINPSEWNNVPECVLLWWSSLFQALSHHFVASIGDLCCLSSISRFSIFNAGLGWSWHSSGTNWMAIGSHKHRHEQNVTKIYLFNKSDKVYVNI